LSPHVVKEPGDDGDEVLRFRQPGPEPAKAAQPAVRAQREIIVPEWLQRDAPAFVSRHGAITPSAAIDDEIGTPPGHGDGTGLLRGRLMHRLMQSLPDVPPERRAEAARRYLARAGSDFNQDDHALMAAELAAVLDHSSFASLFGPGSRAEVPVVGRIARDGAAPLPVSGQVDRLAVTADAVLIADYKTNRPAPRRLEYVPPSYIAQLALYRAVLALLYPDRTIRAALVWTEVPDLMEIPISALDQALMQLTSA
jgi:ATP-dependent helicase/nuclease subunit A